MKKKILHKIDKHITVMLSPCAVPGCKNPGNYASAYNKETDKLMDFCKPCTIQIRRYKTLQKKKAL